MEKGIYLCSFKARFPGQNIVYNDIDPGTKADIIGDALHVDLRKFTFVLASPPCNFWSRANNAYETSAYAQKTKHLLPSMLSRLSQSGKPFILENVRNRPRMGRYHIWELVSKFGLYVYEVNRHTYFTNRMFNPWLPKMHDFRSGGYAVVPNKDLQGGGQVSRVFTQWMRTQGIIKEVRRNDGSGKATGNHKGVSEKEGKV